MDLDILSKYNQWNSELEEKYLKLWPEAEYHIWDGVISPNDYFRSPLKILFLNKEAYDTEYDSYDISEALKEELELSKPIFNNRPIKYNFKNRLFVLKLISNLNQSYLTDDVYNQYSNEEFYHDMLKTAYCNIKKSDGKGKSNSQDLRYCFLRNKEIIEEQISFLNPSLIIGGNVVDGIIEDGVNGFLCKQDDEEDLANVIRKITNLPKEKLNEISRNAQKTALDYTDSKVAARYLAEIS